MSVPGGYSASSIRLFDGDRRRPTHAPRWARNGSGHRMARLRTLEYRSDPPFCPDDLLNRGDGPPGGVAQTEDVEPALGFLTMFESHGRIDPRE